MSEIKSLADQIRQRQLKTVERPKGKAATERAGTTGGAEKTGPAVKLSSEDLQAFLDDLLACGQDEELTHMIHIRVSGRDYRRLAALGIARISMQKLTLYALRRLLDSPEITQQLKNIYHDMD